MSGQADQLNRLKAALADRYAIDRELGRGGMATVYLAEDLKNKRQVAIKVLKPEIAAALGPDRFVREIAITAKLDHPHILPLHDSGEADGFLYYVMPYVEGETLRDRLNREKQLPIDDALQITREVADALEYAHQHEVIHRDIKPENILLAAGHARVADFGIARAISVAGGDRLTETGLAVGTAEYMSPEQAAGEGDIDRRSDVYALGCVLYELLAGRPPFTGPSVESVIHQHLAATPHDVTTMRPGVSAQVTAALRKALDKTPADRFGTAARFVEALSKLQELGHPPAQRIKRVGVIAAGITASIVAISSVIVWWIGSAIRRSDDFLSGPVRLAVFPFENLGSEGDSPFVDGLTDEIRNKLHSLSGLSVIARQSSMLYRSSEKTPQEIATELQVPYLLEGTISWEASGTSKRLRIRPRLIRASDASMMWSDAFDEDFREVFAIQSRIAERVAQALEVTLLEPERGSLVARPTRNLEGYEHFLRGVDYLNQGGYRRTIQLAVEMLQRAVDLDSTFALAWAKLGDAHGLMIQLGHDPSDARASLAKAAVDRALLLDPSLPEASLALGWYYYRVLNDYERALRQLDDVLRIQPDNVDALFGQAVVHRRLARWEQAAHLGARAVSLDPRNATYAYSAGSIHKFLRRYDEAETLLRRAILNSADWLWPDAHLAHLHLMARGDRESAMVVLEDARRRTSGTEVASWLVVPDFWSLLRTLYSNEEAVLDDVLRAMPDPTWDNRVGALLSRARIRVLRGHHESSLTTYDSVLAAVEKSTDPFMIGTEVGVAYADVFAGIALAELGRREEALVRLRRAVEDAKVAFDRFHGDVEARKLIAEGFVHASSYNDAIEQLDYLLSKPSAMSVPLLEVDPLWDPLREDPKFKALLRKHRKFTLRLAAPGILGHLRSTGQPEQPRARPRRASGTPASRHRRPLSN